ncbi:MAG: hypothetical protein IJI97_05855 [Clostridia bacterium]|nr:hypothetical protein [Clostridia bacterium]
MQINFTLRDMISAKEVGYDEEVESNVWSVYFLGVEIAREPEPWSRYEGPEDILKDKYTEILGEKLKILLGMGEEQE